MRAQTALTGVPKKDFWRLKISIGISEGSDVTQADGWDCPLTGRGRSKAQTFCSLFPGPAKMTVPPNTLLPVLHILSSVATNKGWENSKTLSGGTFL